MAAALWNELVDTGEMLSKAATLTSPAGAIFAAIKAFSGEDPFDDLTKYAEGKKMEITPEMRSGAASAEAILVFSPTSISKLKILSNAAKVNKAEKLIKEANVVEELKRVRQEKDITSGPRSAEKTQAEIPKPEPKPPGNSPKIPSSEHRPGMEKKIDEIRGKGPGTPQSDIKKPSTSNEPNLSDKSTTSHAHVDQTSGKKPLSEETPPRAQDTTILTKEENNGTLIKKTNTDFVLVSDKLFAPAKITHAKEDTIAKRMFLDTEKTQKIKTELSDSHNFKKRVNELAPEAGVKRTRYNEGIGATRYEMATGRKVTRSQHVGADYIDPELGPIDLKGPLLKRDGSTFQIKESNISDLIQQIIEKADRSHGSKAIVVDLFGLTKEQIAHIKNKILKGQKGNKPIIYME